MNNLKSAIILVGHGGLPSDIPSEIVEKFMRIHKVRIKTGSEITKQEKGLISHRGKAVKALISFLSKD